jgi:hypothetical protein
VVLSTTRAQVPVAAYAGLLAVRRAASEHREAHWLVARRTSVSGVSKGTREMARLSRGIGVRSAR